MPKGLIGFERTLIVLAFLGGVIGLTWLGRYVTNSGAEGGARGAVVRAEIADILAPDALIEMARDPSATRILESPESVRRYLAEHTQQGTWYAIVRRLHQEDGRVVTMPSFCYPHEIQWNLDELRSVMATLAGNPPSHPLCDFGHARVLIIPSQRVTDDPRDVIAEMTGRSDGAGPPCP